MGNGGGLLVAIDALGGRGTHGRWGGGTSLRVLCGIAVCLFGLLFFGSPVATAAIPVARGTSGGRSRLGHKFGVFQSLGSPFALASGRLALPRAATSESQRPAVYASQAPGLTAQSVAGVGLFGVTCTSASSCLAVGVSDAGQDVVVPIGGGVPGSVVAGDDQVTLSEIACASASSCVAVGSNDQFTEGAVVPITDGVPGPAVFVPGAGDLIDVACDSTGACVADGVNEQFTEGVVVTVSGGTPGAVQLVPGTGILVGMTCSAPGSCVSVGSSADFFSGVVVPIDSGVAGGAETATGTSSLSDIDCASSGVCTAVGLTTGHAIDFAAVPVSAGSPGLTQTTPDIADAVELPQAPSAVACVSAALCLAAGSDEDQEFSGDVSPIVDGAPGIEQQVSGTGGLFDLACAAGGNCVAIGQSSDGQSAVVSFPPGIGAPATTSVTLSPANGLFEQTSTATVTVSSPAGTPTGLVYFAIDGVYADYPQTLGSSGQTTFSMRGLAPGSHTLAASYVGPSGVFSPAATWYQPTTGSGSNTLGCATTITGQQNRGLNISRVGTCISNASVAGSVNIQPGASASIASSTIAGSLTATTAGALRMCATSVGGSLNVTNATGYVLVGDRAPNEDYDSCAADTITGSVNLVNDAHGATLLADTIGGSLHTSNDSGVGGFPFETAPELAPNTVSGNNTFLANRQSGAQGQTTDGIQCGSVEQLAVHYHAHLAIFAHGRPLAIPEGVGMVGQIIETPTPNGPFALRPSDCLYWVHVHDQTGMIHMELPANFTVTLGDFFDIWGQTLSSSQVGPEHGTVTAFVNGAKYSGDPRNIVLGDHTLVQLDIGGPIVPPQPFEFTAASR
jgi:hypothetical protein